MPLTSLARAHGLGIAAAGAGAGLVDPIERSIQSARGTPCISRYLKAPTVSDGPNGARRHDALNRSDEGVHRMAAGMVALSRRGAGGRRVRRRPN